MFDQQDLGKPFSDDYNEGDIFTLTDISLGPVIPTKHGPGQVVFLTIDGEKYSIFGQGIENQARSMGDGDLPAEVMLVSRPTKKPGNTVKLLVPAAAADAITEF